MKMTTPPPVLLKDPAQFVKGMTAMCRANDAMMLYNHDTSIKFMIRNDPDAGLPHPNDGFAFELCIVTDEIDDPEWTRIFDLEHDGYLCDDGCTFLMDSLTVKVDSPSSVRRAMDRINEIYIMRRCPCNRYLIRRHSGVLCTYCTITASQVDLVPTFCPICQDESPRLHMNQQPCCQQFVHTACLARWRVTAPAGPPCCPLCRAAVKPITYDLANEDASKSSDEEV